MRSLSRFAVLGVIVALVSAVAPAQAVHLKVLAVNSGADIQAPYDSHQNPTMTSGAKGFLISVVKDDGQGLLAVQNLEFFGVVHQQGINDAGLTSSFPFIHTRVEAVDQGAEDGINYLREDTYLIDSPQMGATWTFASDSHPHGGLAPDIFFRIPSAVLGVPSNPPTGEYKLVYLVATGDVFISGNILSEANGVESYYTVRGNPTLPDGISIERLSFDEERIVPFPEPSSANLAIGCGVAALALLRRLRTRRVARGLAD